MNHNQAVEQLAVERYLLGELDVDAREDFEEHLFSCPECALDARVATVFIEEAKAELNEMALSQPEVKGSGKKIKFRTHWLFWMRPAFAVPVFAVLGLVTVYQNLITIPALREAGNQPAILPVAPVSGATRGDTHTTITVDRAQGIALPVDIPLDPVIGKFDSYSFKLYDQQNKLDWSATIPSPGQTTTGDLQLSISMPGRILKDGTYSVSISGRGAQGESTPIERYVFNVISSK
jgi:hypothetical protein